METTILGLGFRVKGSGFDAYGFLASRVLGLGF